MSAKKKFKLTVVNLGLKMFQKNKENKSEGEYRLLQEGLEVLLPYMDERRQIKLQNGDFFRALVEPVDKMLNFEKIEAQFGAPMRRCFTEIPKGSAVLRFPSANGEMQACTIWIGVNNVSMMLNKEEIKSFLFLLS